MAVSPFVAGYPQQSFGMWQNASSEVNPMIVSQCVSRPSLDGPGFVPRSAEGPVKPQRGLRLIWCSERCHKNEMRELRTALLQSAQALGAQLQCLKKAVKFSAWLRSGQRQPYILVADWREVKPCMDALQEESDCNQPRDIVVLAESARVLERAELWAASRPDDDLVLVEESGNVREVIVKTQAQKRQPKAQKAAASADRACLPSSASASCKASGFGEDDDASSTCSGSISSALGSGSGSGSHMATATSVACMNFSVSTPSHSITGPRCPPSAICEEADKRVINLLFTVCGTIDAQVIESMLLAAVP
eukprot:CAMPEP_0206605410 /NCGR_PEP_ID=MMETSP0325_2-20121206/50398_1 /ASSEMBLY_ACC=CAM_ASM_000347 /TAXON_ID=2866 /ORGANISM="Crypthecodinium cohnii, Strain Seligo" /LENGTH=306 /DNA_ID=CAMNT_0054120947 /DNA_START=19 /DNA_END=936 /DNA_ORIENTATION=+